MEDKPSAKAPAREKARSKLSYKAQRELEALPGEIEALEAEQRALEEKMSAENYYKLRAEEVERDRKRAEETEGGVDGEAGEVGGVGGEESCTWLYSRPIGGPSQAVTSRNQ